MAFEIEYSPDALVHLQSLRKFDRVKVIDAIDQKLRSEPTAPSRHRKQMRSNLLFTWELRVGNFRAYYDVDAERRTVLIRAIGIKARDRVTIGGEEVDLS
jgi:mRNA-degrading endonuclease RelE of RelBE toxin-antitoxin system